MKSSSAAQLELEYPTSTMTPRWHQNSIDAIEDNKETTGTASTLRAPDFGSLASVYAITSRRAGRLNATKATPKEVADLLAKRQALLDKKFAGTITRQEENRLEYVRWSLDRIEDARHGETLDHLEAAVVRYEQLEDRLRDLKGQLMEHLPRARKQVKRRKR